MKKRTWKRKVMASMLAAAVVDAAVDAALDAGVAGLGIHTKNLLEVKIDLHGTFPCRSILSAE